MAEPEYRNPLGQIPVESVDSHSNIPAAPAGNDPTLVAKPQDNATIDLVESVESSSTIPQAPAGSDPTVVPKDNATIGVDELAALVQNVRIIDEDEDFDEGKSSMQTVDWKKENKEMDKMFEQAALEQLKDLPEFEMPEGFKKDVEFFPHQIDGIRWLVQQERGAPPNPFVRSRVLKSGEKVCYDRLTRRRLQKPHAPVKGSILADDMGLGKTVQTLALILLNPPEGYEFMGDGEDCADPICTLICCPKSVISNWMTQAKTFVKKRRLNIVAYTGTAKQRTKIIGDVEDNLVDILLTSYETVTSEFSRDEKDGILGVHDIRFHRIVLDEAQQIRNPKSKCFKAIDAVAKESLYRLALTGTPFVNKPEDISSLLSFINLQPLNDANLFRTFISDPIKERKRAGLTRLRAALAYVALRRTKNKSQIDMVPKEVNIVAIEFPEGEHKDIHDVLYLAAQGAFEASINGRGKEYTESEGGVTANAQQAMFSLLMRVRQSCASGNLVSAGHYKTASEALAAMKDDNGQMRQLSAQDGNDLISHLTDKKPESDERLTVDGNSPKIEALLSKIQEMEQDEKAVIFSQWTSMLDLVGVALKKAGHRFTRIDGSMSVEERTQALEDITDNESVRFILCSLKAAGTGLNMTRANVCFMMDPWWNAAIENQAIDRIHRMGQTRPVRVYRLVMKHSIEERMLNVQKAKSAMGEGTMRKLSAAEERVAKITSIKDLFEIKESKDDLAGFIDNSSDDWY